MLDDRALPFLVVVSNERLQKQWSKSGKCHKNVKSSFFTYR
jgi:hypothetical protein